MNWNPEQQQALDWVKDWLHRDEPTPQVFRLFGYAGTGKTTLAKELSTHAKDDVLFGAYTGKAAHVLQSKGCPARTIHSLIYLPRAKATARLEELEDALRSSVNKDEQQELSILIRAEQEALKSPSFTLNIESDVRDASLVIIDEVSMVGTRMGEHLLSFDTPVLVLGDPAQLPPVREGGFFTDQEPDVMLTEVHRHGGHVLEMATLVRRGDHLPMGHFGDSAVLKRGSLCAEEVMDFDVVLTGKNKTAAQLNAKIRRHLGRTSHLPEVGDRLLCRRNNHDIPLLNGSQWMVQSCDVIDDDRISLAISEAGERIAPLRVTAWRHYFEDRADQLSHWEVRENERFDFGYAITCHKAQGSQWNRVLVIDESRVFGEPRRWLYTAITRASESVTILR